MEWWEDPQVFLEKDLEHGRIGDGLKRPEFLIGEARNQTMIDFQLRLLGEEIFEARQLQYPKEGIGNCRINLAKLAENREIRESIRQSNKACKNAHFTMIPNLHSKYK